MKAKTQAIIWVIVFGLITISPIFTFYYFDFIVFIVTPFSLWIMIKMIIEIVKGKYEEKPRKPKFIVDKLKILSPQEQPQQL